VGNVLKKRINDVRWDVREREMEVLKVVKDIEEIKFKELKEKVMENELCKLVMVMEMDE
jgi:hypothetical protein